MQTSRVVLLTVLVVAGLTSMALAQQPGSAPRGAKPGGLLVEVSDWPGKVTAVDYTKRTVTLQVSSIPAPPPQNHAGFSPGSRHSKAQVGGSRGA